MILTNLEIDILRNLQECYADTCPNYEILTHDVYDISWARENTFRVIDLRPTIMAAVRHLKELGLVVTEKGLMTEDGEVAGSGFSLNYERVRDIRKVLDDIDGRLKIEIAENMEKRGGSFVKALSQCIIHADPVNFERLETVFRDYFDDYTPKEWEVDL